MKKFQQFVTEVSTGKLVDYVAAASKDVGRRIEKAEPGAKPFKKILDRSSKIGRAMARVKMKTYEQNDMCNVCGQTPCNCTSIDEIKMSDDDYKSTVDSYGKRATNLLKHSWSQHDVGREKAKAGDKEGAAKASSTGSRAHKLFLKARDKHLSNPENAERSRKKIMSGATSDYKDQEAKRGIGHVRDSVEMDDTNTISEISQGLKDRYVDRAVTAHSGYNMARRNTVGKVKEYFARKEANTKKGISRALAVKEDVEQVNELNKTTLASYVKKASMNASDQSYSAGARGNKDKHSIVNLRKAEKRQIGVEKAVDRLTKEDVQSVSELRISTLMRYNTKAHASSHKLGVAAARSMDVGDNESWAKNANKRDNRDKGILRSAIKLRNKTTKQG